MEFEFANQEFFHVCAFVSVIRQIPEKAARYVYLIQTDADQNFSCICVLNSDSGLKAQECAVFSCWDCKRENLNLWSQFLIAKTAPARLQPQNC